MPVRTIRVSSRALGERVYVTAKVYDSLDEMRSAARRHSGLDDYHDTIGVCQAYIDETGRAVRVVVRLVRGRLSTQIVVHEMHHASTALYGAHVADVVERAEHLNHHNEPFAHLHSDLTQRLVDRLYDLGYYGDADTD